VTDTNAKLDIQAPSTAITEIAKGMSDVRDALQAMADFVNPEWPHLGGGSWPNRQVGRAVSSFPGLSPVSRARAAA
jgi:hypothetical protein